MGKKIHHMGMTLAKKKHDLFHDAAPTLSPTQHETLMKRMGITKEQDEEWHRTHLTLAEQRAQALKRVEPTALGASLVAWCVKQGWLVQRGKECFATRQGLLNLREHFDISI